MDRKAVSRGLMESFIRMVNKYNAMERFPLSYGTETSFFHSERHLMDVLRNRPGLNITQMAQAMGVTKGAVSQAVAKLEKKGAVERHKTAEDDKQVLVRLTDLGIRITEAHHEINEKSVEQLRAAMEDHPDEQVEFVREMFRWIEGHLDDGLIQMGSSRGKP